MKRQSRSKLRNRAHNQLSQLLIGEVETCESRLLLTTPNVLSPTGSVTGATVDFSWEAVDNAESYEIWVSSLETFRQSYYQNGVAGTDLSVPVEELNTGKVRIWVRANLEGGGTSAWSPGSDALIRSAPTILAPVGLTNDATPEISWSAPKGSSYFQIWVNDLEKQAEAIAAAEAEALATGSEVVIDSSSFAQVYNIDNRVLDDDGNPVLDSGGQVILREIRSLELPENPADEDGPAREFTMGRYRVWIRSFDNSFATTPNETPAWSAPSTFTVGTQVDGLGPEGSTINVSPVLTWNGVEGATHYEVYIRQAGQTGAFFRRTVEASGSTGVQSTQMVLSRTGDPIVENGNGTTENSEIPLLDLAGNERLYQLPHAISTNQLNEDIITVSPAHAAEYIFWVRAIRDVEDSARIVGDWSDSVRFRTLEPPTVTAPVPVDGLVTAHRPTVEWTEINGAARYEVLIHKLNERSPFHRASSSTTSYTLTENITPGTYTVWVRALDVTGNYSGWSASYQFVSSGGAPIITSPAPGTSQTFLSVVWTPVEDAVSYQIWVSEEGVNFTAIVQDGIATNSFSTADPLNDSIYRVWVRALRTDGTYGPWSDSIAIQGSVVELDSAPPEDASILVKLDALSDQSDTEVVQTDAEAVAIARAQEQPPADTVERVDMITAELQNVAEFAMPPERTAVDPVTEAPIESDDLLAKIAENCVDSEWWMPREDA